MRFNENLDLKIKRIIYKFFDFQLKEPNHVFSVRNNY